MITNKVYLIRLDFNYITTLTSAFSFSFFFFSTSWIHQISITPAIKKRTLSILRHFVIKCLTSIAPFVCSCYTQKRFIYCSGKTLNCFPVIVGGNHPAFDEQCGKIVVCNVHRKKQDVPSFVYPGPPFSLELNYRKRSSLSPVKTMSQTTRNLSSSRVFCGHYEVSGSIWTHHNLEFSQMLYGGALGIPYVRDMMANINLERVREAFQALLQTNAWLHPYRTMPVAERMQVMFEDHVRAANRDHPQTSFGRTHNYAMPANDVHPQAGEQSFANLLFGTDVFDNDVSYCLGKGSFR